LHVIGVPDLHFVVLSPVQSFESLLANVHLLSSLQTKTTVSVAIFATQPEMTGDLFASNLQNESHVTATFVLSTVV